MNDAAVKSRYQQIERLVEDISLCLQAEVEKLGFKNSELTLLPPADASYRLEKDPYNGEYSLAGDWLNDAGFKQGSLLFHSDGSFFVEQDIVRPHPQKKKWFVEAVNAWGKGSNINSEARLLPMP